MPDHQPGCSCCHAELDPADFDVRSEYPDPILALPDEERAQVWGGRNLMQHENLGAFVRCLMPVRLTGGGRVTYSAWLGVHPDDLKHAYEVWNAPEYAGLTLAGRVANAIKPWADIFREPARAEVRDTDTLPYLVAEEGTLLWRVLNEEWDRDDVLSRIWHALPTTVRQQVTETWSIERTAGLEPNAGDGEMTFVGDGRRVRFEPFEMPDDPDEVFSAIVADTPRNRDGELAERDGEVRRQSFWRTGSGPHELHGVAVAPGSIARLTCVFDDVADLAWAQGVMRSVRYDAER